MIFQRLIGAVMVVVGVIGLVLSVPGAIYGHRLVDEMARSLDATLDSTSQSLLTVQETLRVAKTTAGQINAGLDTLKTTATDVSQAIDGSQPLLDEIAQVAAQDVPDGLDAVQAAVPDMAHAAAVIEDTLTTLSNLQLTQNVLGFPIRFELGIEYAPETPLDDSINTIGQSLEGVPVRLRGLQAHLDSAGSSLETISGDILAAVQDLEAVEGSIAEVPSLLDEYLEVVSRVRDLIEQTRASIAGQLGMVKLAVTLVIAWIGLAQLAPLYLGWELLSGRRTRGEARDQATQ